MSPYSIARGQRSFPIRSMALRKGCTGLATLIFSLMMVIVSSRTLAQQEEEYAQGAVSSGHPLASAAGERILEQGGNAADAVAATMLAMGVVSPVSSGLGGGGFAMYYSARDGSSTFLDFRETAPRAATATMFVPHGVGDQKTEAPSSRFGGLATGVPGEAAGIDALLKRFGSLSRRKVVAPALGYAQKGIPISAHMARLSKHFAKRMQQDPNLRSWFAPGAEQMKAGALLKQGQLAKTLKQFALHGAKPFYRGSIARAIVKRNQQMGGIMSLRDLKDYRVEEREPLQGNAFGYRWVTAPPPSAGGYTLLHSLALLQQWVSPKQRRAGPWMHAMAESWKGAFGDRAQYIGDPKHVEVPLKALRADQRLQKRVARFHPLLAMPQKHYALPLEDNDLSPAKQPGGHGTSHICVVDKEGNVAAVTTTVNIPFGASYSAAGMIMNDEMDDFARPMDTGRNAYGLAGGIANLPGPGRRPVSTMTPTLLFKDGKPVMCLGAGAGGTRIVTALQQVALRMILGKRPADAAVNAPRIHHQGDPAFLRIENKRLLPHPLLRYLTKRGHRVKIIEFIAAVNMIHIKRNADGSINALHAVSDPRKGGGVAGLVPIKRAKVVANGR